MTRFVHYSDIVLVASGMVLLVTLAVGIVWPPWWGSTALCIIALFLMCLGAVGQLRHHRGPCGWWIPAIPLDAQAQAAHQWRTLRLFHLLRSGTVTGL